MATMAKQMKMRATPMTRTMTRKTVLESAGLRCTSLPVWLLVGWSAEQKIVREREMAGTKARERARDGLGDK